MATFECDGCGRCCVSLGSLISIERQLSDREYYCRNKIDNTLFPVRVDSAYCEEIADEFETGDSAPLSPGKNSCRFLRKNRDGEGTICAIYATRPKVCRDFRCYHMLIRNHEGAVCGHVIGKNTIRTEDVTLEQLWTGHVAEIPYGDAAAWIKTVTGILAEHGYRADPVE